MQGWLAGTMEAAGEGGAVRFDGSKVAFVEFEYLSQEEAIGSGLAMTERGDDV